MLTLQELRAVGMMALQLPHALRRRGCGTIQHVAERNARYPVLLVHGYAGSESVWTPLRRALAEAGFGHIVSLSYNSFVTDPVALSAELTHQALRALAAAGAPRVHLIGHSLGGLIVRCALAASAALSVQTASAVTIASPHRGAHLARIAPGRCARIMHRGPRSVLPGADAPRPARWLAYYSDADRVVPPASARLDDPSYGAANLLIPGCGHLTICRLTGCPVLAGATAAFDCLLRQSHRAGDHLIVLGEVVALVHRPQLEPLIFHAGTYTSLERQPWPADGAAARRLGRDPGIAGRRPHRRVA